LLLNVWLNASMLAWAFVIHSPSLNPLRELESCIKVEARKLRAACVLAADAVHNARTYTDTTLSTPRAGTSDP
jgi:hypothetical protein